jgi:MSHA biogenesis protein MshM
MKPADTRNAILDHYSLREAPFSLTPHTDFFYDGGDRGAVLQALNYACQHTEGVITLTGEVGTGKTMLSRMLVEQRPRHIELVYIANPSMTRDEIVATIAGELRMRIRELRPVEILKALQKRLIDLHAKGKRVMVLIDEAHVIPPETLEEIRLLSNLETRQHKLLRIILVGQDELKQTLATPAMRPLRERITERFHLGPLNAGDVAEYLSCRLRRAGGDPQTFEPRAAALLARASAGLSRRVNILADKAMLAAFCDGQRFVGEQHVRQAIDEAAFIPLKGWRHSLVKVLQRLLDRFHQGGAALAR